MSKDYYLKVGRAEDLLDKKERFLFRFFEMVPGLLCWLTFALSLFLSWKRPVWVATFIIFFIAYWFIRNIYFSLHLASCYKKMEQSEKTDWIGELKKLKANDCALKISWEHVYHLIIIPMYKEPISVVREVFESLAFCDYPKNRMIVVLACEGVAKKETADTAMEIEKEYKNEFFRFLVTWHPGNIPGEIAGKGSNDTWAVKRAKELIIDPLGIPYENIIESSLDADTCVFPKYFSCLSFHYLTVKNPTHCSYQPVPLFINNIWQAPAISRIFAFSASFWEMMCQERPEKLITFSSHSMSFKAIIDIDFKQTNVVSDDSRIFWQCFFQYNGNYEVVPLFYPISMDANVAPTIFKTAKNVYRQQRRWAYGVGEIPYFLFGILKNKKIPFSKKFFLGFSLFENHWSWATNSILLFFLGWFPILLGGEGFKQTVFSYNLPVFTRNILTLAMLGLVGSIYLSMLLLPPRPPEFGKKKYLYFTIEWFLIPIILIFFYALPAIEAQTRWMLGKYLGFWPTPKIRK